MRNIKNRLLRCIAALGAVITVMLSCVNALALDAPTAKTGDSTTIVIVILAIVMVAAVIAVILLSRKK